MLVWKHVQDVISWRHKQRTLNTNDHHMPLNENPPRKIFCVRHCLFMSRWLRYLLCTCSTWLKPCSAIYVVGKSSGNILNFSPNFWKTLTAVDTKVWSSVLIKYGTGFNVALDVDENSWTWNRIRLCWQDGGGWTYSPGWITPYPQVMQLGRCSGKRTLECFCPPRKCVGHSFKILGPCQKTLRPPDVPNWLQACLPSLLFSYSLLCH